MKFITHKNWLFGTFRDSVNTKNWKTLPNYLRCIIWTLLLSSILHIDIHISLLFYPGMPSSFTLSTSHTKKMTQNRKQTIGKHKNSYHAKKHKQHSTHILVYVTLQWIISYTGVFFTEPEKLFLMGGSHKNMQRRSSVRVVSRFESATGLLSCYLAHYRNSWK